MALLRGVPLLFSSILGRPKCYNAGVTREHRERERMEDEQLELLMEYLELLNRKVDMIMATQDEVLATLAAAKTAADTIQGMVSQIVNGPKTDVPAVVADAVTALNDELQATATALTPAPAA